MYNKKILIDALKKLGNAKAPTQKKDTVVGSNNPTEMFAMQKGFSPYDKKLSVKKSNIHGKGLFTEQPLKKGELIGLAHVNNQPTSVVGNFHNHSENNATALNIRRGNQRYLVAAKDLEPGTEITTNYRLQPELGQPEDFQHSINETPTAKNGGMTPQKDGYRTYSPFKHLPFIDVESDTIDTDNIIYDLQLVGNNGVIKNVEKNSGLHRIPGASVIREIPMGRKGGSAPKLPGKKNSRAYSRSLDATNRLFAEHPWFKKSKSRKNKIFDPNARYYQPGGETGCPEGYAFNPKTGECIEWNPTVWNTEDESTSFDPVADIIYMNPNDRPDGMSDQEYNQMYQDQLEHEQLHRLQWLNDELQGESKIPLRMPSPVDNQKYDGPHYYNRRQEEADYLHNYWKSMYPENAQFIPDDVIYNKETDPAMYQLPWTVEGEARDYEYATHDGMPSFFPKRKKGGALPKAQDGTIWVKDENDPRYQDYLIRQALYNYSNNPNFNVRDLETWDLYDIIQSNNLQDLQKYNDSYYDNLVPKITSNTQAPYSDDYSRVFFEGLTDPNVGYYGSEVNYQTIPNNQLYTDVDYRDSNFTLKNLEFNNSFFRQYPPLNWQKKQYYTNTPYSNWYQWMGTNDSWTKPDTLFIEDKFDRDALKKVYPNLTDAEIDEWVNEVRTTPPFITRLTDPTYGNNIYADTYDINDNYIADPNKKTFRDAQGQLGYLPEKIANNIKKFNEYLPVWPKPTVVKIFPPSIDPHPPKRDLGELKTNEYIFPDPIDHPQYILEPYKEKRLRLTVGPGKRKKKKHRGRLDGGQKYKWTTYETKKELEFHRPEVTRLIPAIVQKLTGYDPKYFEGYYDEEGAEEGDEIKFIPGELDYGNEVGGKMEFKGAASLRDFMNQIKYKKEYEEYEKKLDEWSEKFNAIYNEKYGLEKKKQEQGQSFKYGGLSKFLNGGPQCPEGYTYNPETKRCTRKNTNCPEGYFFDAQEGRCKSKAYREKAELYVKGNKVVPTEEQEKYPWWPDDLTIKTLEPRYSLINPEKRLSIFKPGLSDLTYEWSPLEVDIYPDLNYEVVVDPNKPKGYNADKSIYYVPDENNLEFEKFKQYKKLKEVEKENLANLAKYPNLTTKIESGYNWDDAYLNPEYMRSSKPLTFDEYKNIKREEYQGCTDCTYGHGEKISYDTDDRITEKNLGHVYNKFYEIPDYDTRYNREHDYVDLPDESMIPRLDLESADTESPIYREGDPKMQMPHVDIKLPQNQIKHMFDSGYVTNKGHLKFGTHKTNRPIPALVQKFTGYDPEYYQGYNKEVGDETEFVPGEIERAEQEGRKVNFKGAATFRDLKKQKEYDRQWLEYQKQRDEVRQRNESYLKEYDITPEEYEQYYGPFRKGGQLPRAQWGGEYDVPVPEHLQDYTNAIMKARLAYANEFGNPAAKRMINIPDNPYDFGNGMTGTHYMSSMDNYAVPQIQDENGQLNLGDYGPSSREAMKFDNPNDAKYFAEHYKDVSPAFIEIELTPKEIEKYAKGGYIIEDISIPSLTKMQGGGRNLIKGLTEPSKTIKDVGAVGRELFGEILQGSSNRKAIAAGNTWLDNWISHPVTQAKIEADILNAPFNPEINPNIFAMYTTPVYGDIQVNAYDKYIHALQSAKNFRSGVKEYPIISQINDLIDDYGTENESMHLNSRGFTTLHQVDPFQRELFKYAYYKPNSTVIDKNYKPWTNYGSFVSRSPFISQNDRESISIHEGTHDWITDWLLRRTGQFNLIQSLLNPEYLDFYKRWVAKDKTLTKEEEMKGYFADPTEVHARIMQLRRHNNLTPFDTIDDLNSGYFMDQLLRNDVPFNGPRFAEMLGKDRSKLAKLMNALYGIAIPLGVAAGATNLLKNPYKEESPIGGYKMGGEFELGDEVDETTMNELKKLGFTFEKI